jgi:hypothetical protein
MVSVGTKSVLYGAHCFFLHPWFVAASWWKLYGFRRVRCQSTGVTTCLLDPLLWLCFWAHDIGYACKPNMDGPEGETHPYLGARIVGWAGLRLGRPGDWYRFCLYHSRFLARRDGCEPSLLCWADKYAIYLTPSWLYIPMTMLTGELEEYMHVNPREIKGGGKSPLQWHAECRAYCKALALEHRDGRVDTWTPRTSR